MSKLITMSFNNKFNRLLVAGICVALLTLHSGCEKLVDVGLPANKVLGESIFTNDSTAIYSVISMYSSARMQISSISLLISSGALSGYGGLSADELHYTGTSASTQEFETNSLQPANGYLGGNLWAPAYSIIYQANACIEGMTASDALTPALKAQLLGECRFVRAFFYFYLVNLFGDVPLITSTDYHINAVMPRTPAADVYRQITTDLEEAQNLMSPTYPSAGKQRPNKWTATALLARTYLYQKKWAQAEATASAVIASGNYNLVTDVNNVFAINSNEAIWQVASAASGVIQTTEGYLFVPAATSVSVPVYAVSTQLYSAFEASDKRRANWMGPKIVNGQTYYYPYKYKVSSSATVKEYYMMFRFAEQYLVRAEARVQQQNIGGAMQDIDSLRKRAGVPLLVNTDPGINQPAMLAAVEQERRRELCFEWGHRWLDLKRNTGFNDVAKTRADEVLEPLKSNWKSTNVLYPVPESERNLNPYLVQNKGYE